MGGYVASPGGLMALPLLLVLLQAAQAPVGSVPAWTLHFNGDIRWQQITPAGALLVSSDGGLAGVDVERGQITWQKPELGGLPVDSVRMVEGSLLMEAAKPGLSIIFDPVTGTELFDSRRLNLTQVVTRRVLPQTGTLIVHGRRASGPPVVALYDLATGNQRWVSESLFQQSGPKRGGLGGLMQGLVRMASEVTTLEVLQAGPEVIVVNTLTSLRGLDARTGATRWSATLPTARAGNPARHVRLFPSIDKPDRIYVGFDDRLMAYRLADGQPLWAKPAMIEGWVHDIVQHPGGIIILPESPPADQATGNVRIVNGVVQTGLNIARYEDGTTIAAKPLRMRGTVTDAIITGGSAVLAVDAESRTFVNVLDVATATVRLPKDVKIKGQLAYAELTPAGLLYVSRSDAATNGEVNVIDLARGEPKYKDAIEGTKSAGGALLHGVEGRTLYVFTSRDHKLYAVDRQDGTYRALSPEIKLQGNEDPTGGDRAHRVAKPRRARTRRADQAASLLSRTAAPRPVARPLPDQLHPRRSLRRRRLGVRRRVRASLTAGDRHDREADHGTARGGLHPGRGPAAGILEPGSVARVKTLQGLARYADIRIHADALTRWERQRAAADRQGQRAAAGARRSGERARAHLCGRRYCGNAVPADGARNVGRLPTLGSPTES